MELRSTVIWTTANRWREASDGQPVLASSMLHNSDLSSPCPLNSVHDHVRLASTSTDVQSTPLTTATPMPAVVESGSPSRTIGSRIVEFRRWAGARVSHAGSPGSSERVTSSSPSKRATVSCGRMSLLSRSAILGGNRWPWRCPDESVADVKSSMSMDATIRRRGRGRGARSPSSAWAGTPYGGRFRPAGRWLAMCTRRAWTELGHEFDGQIGGRGVGAFDRIDGRSCRIFERAAIAVS
jgi:hypothetical protein